jgi:hypothetical protein
MKNGKEKDRPEDGPSKCALVLKGVAVMRAGPFRYLKRKTPAPAEVYDLVVLSMVLRP